MFLFIASKSQCGLPVQHGNGFLISSMEHSQKHPNSSTQRSCLPSPGFSFSCSSYSCIADTQLLWMSSPNRFRSATDLSTSSASRAMHSNLGNRKSFVFDTADLFSATQLFHSSVLYRYECMKHARVEFVQETTQFLSFFWSNSCNADVQKLIQSFGFFSTKAKVRTVYLGDNRDPQ